jgi:hypothetical protein
MEPTPARTAFVAVDITCVDCYHSFVFTPGEQKFFAEKDLADPRRCLACRAERRRQKSEGERS